MRCFLPPVAAGMTIFPRGHSINMLSGAYTPQNQDSSHMRLALPRRVHVRLHAQRRSALKGVLLLCAQAVRQPCRAPSFRDRARSL